MPKKSKDWEISIFVPDDAAPPQPGDPNVEDHGLVEWFHPRRVEKVSADVMAQWEATIDRLIALSSTVGKKAKDWAADEITVGFTLSAKGELLFIAEAGASASISVKLKRNSAAA